MAKLSKDRSAPTWRLLAEFACLCAVQLGPKYVMPPTSVFTQVVGVLIIAVYVAANGSHLRSLPRSVLLVAAAYLVAGAGWLTSGDPFDLLDPLYRSLFVLAAMGILATKYPARQHRLAMAVACLVLTPIAMWQSVTRNSVALLDLESSSRFGFNLQGKMAFIAFAFALLLPGLARLLVLAPSVVILRSGSRASGLSALIVLLVGVLFRKRSLGTREILILILLTAAGFLAYAEMERISALLYPDSFSEQERLRDVTERFGPWSFWGNFLLQEPMLQGHGLTTYWQRYSLEYAPHNTYLDMLNGGGLLAGLLYLVACGMMLRDLMVSRLAAPEVAWGMAMLLAVLAHGMFEITYVGESSIHVPSVLLAYGIGMSLARAKVLTHEAKVRRLPPKPAFRPVARSLQ